MEIISTIKFLREAVSNAKTQGKTIGLVPTMGALHAGHVSLINRAREECDFVIVSIFINPTQFNNKNDFLTYPQTVEADCEKLIECGVDIAFVPSVEEIYPEPDTRTFELGEVAEVMEGKMRPGHFNGVAQIVSKLFDYCLPDRAYFGEKDFQQIAVIKKMSELIGFKGKIVECPICREVDGLAMSSRNMRLNADQRMKAPVIYETLSAAADLANQGIDIPSIRELVETEINNVDGMEVEYFDIVDADTLREIESWDQSGPKGAIGCIAVWLGDVRLIDNIKFSKHHDC